MAVSSTGALQSLLLFLKDILATSPTARMAFLPIMRQERMLDREHALERFYYNDEPLVLDPHIPFTPSSGTPTDEESLTLSKFLRFPVIEISSPDVDAPLIASSNAEPRILTIHGRIANALTKESTSNSNPKSHSSTALQFFATVVLVHELAHATRNHFGVDTESHLVTDKPPYYVDNESLRMFPEAGFQVEMALFGGIIGVVFQDEDVWAEPSSVADVDFDRIDHFFLLCRDEKAYRLDISIVEEWLVLGQFTPFQVSALEPIVPIPHDPRLRLCSVFNSTHLQREKVSNDIHVNVSEAAVVHVTNDEGTRNRCQVTTGRRRRLSDEIEGARHIL